MNVLVVDDNRDNRELLLALMQSQGHTVAQAANGLQALDLARTDPPDLIISDLMMPEMDGFTLCRVLKSSEALRHIPVVFYTATYLNAEDKALGCALGAARYLIKPMEPRLFVEDINAVMAEAAQGKLPDGVLPDRDNWALAHTYQERISEKLDKKARDVDRLNHERELILGAAGEGILGLDAQGRYTLVNAAAAALLGYAVEDMIGTPARTLWQHGLPHASALPEAPCPICATLERGEAHRNMEATWWRRDGSAMPVEYSSAPLLEDGAITGAVVVFRDVTERKAAQERQTLAASVFSHAREGIAITDAQGSILEVNATFTQITGYTREEVLGKNPRLLQSSRHSRDFYAALWHELTTEGYWGGELWNKRKNGEVYAQATTISAVRETNGLVRNFVSLFSDVTEIREHQSQIEHMVHFDTLTGLPNRTLLADRLGQALVQCDRHDLSLAVVYLDLDNVKTVNDQYGHDAGDQVLIELSRRMKEALREGDTLARMGGDEFVAVLVDLAQLHDSYPVLEHLLQVAAAPVHVTHQTSAEGALSGAVVRVSASIGVTFYPQDKVDADVLLRHADQAMYLAKQAGKNRYHLFDVTHDAAMKGHHESLKRIHTALQNQEFVLYYQPKVNMRTGEVVGAEALIRWQHPEQGLLPPAAFLDIIERDAISVHVGEWVIATALKQLSAWQAQGLDVPVSVNLGARQLQQDIFAQRLGQLLDAHPDVAPHYLQLEILETSALKDLTLATTAMRSCQALGVTFALDDFGTGYSSLTYLKHLPAEMLKIDQSFVRNMSSSPDDLAIVKGVIGLAEVFHREVIAEGVETKALGDLLLDIGCDLAQGYGIARPMPAKDFPGWVEKWQAGAAWTA